MPSQSTQVVASRLPNRLADDLRLVAAATKTTPSELLREAIASKLQELRAA